MKRTIILLLMLGFKNCYAQDPTTNKSFLMRANNTYKGNIASNPADVHYKTQETPTTKLQLQDKNTSNHLFKPVTDTFKALWYNGDTEIYIPFYAWHNRYTYCRERLKKYNELALGGGAGKTILDMKDNQHMIYAFVFLDSHRDIEPIGGYAYAKTLRLDSHSFIGAGFTVFLTARTDMFNNAPFPGLLPLITYNADKFSYIATYVPGIQNTGNVLLMIFKWRL